jgi:hypothetical protein
LSAPDCLFDSSGVVARTQLCDDCQIRNTPLEADDNAAHATPPMSPAGLFQWLLPQKGIAV